MESFFINVYIFFLSGEKFIWKRSVGKLGDISILKARKWWFICKVRKCLRFLVSIFNYVLFMNGSFF